MVCPRIPYPPYIGGNVRLFNLIKRISASVELSLLCRSDIQALGNAEELKPYCKEIHIVPVHDQRPLLFKMARLFKPSQWQRTWARAKMLLQGIPPALVRPYLTTLREKLKELVERERFDVIQFEFVDMGLYALDLRQWAARSRAAMDRMGKIVLVEHDITSVVVSRERKRASLFKKLILGYDYLFLEKFEKKYFTTFDLIIAMTDVDREKILNAQPKVKDLAVITTGVDIQVHRPVRVTCANPHLVFLGTMKYLPNREGIEWFLNRVFPLVAAEYPDVRLSVIGEQDPEVTRRYENAHVTFHGIVPDLDPHMENAIFICPTRIGAGIKTKNITAMAFGIPIVSTAVGMEGIHAREPEGVIVARDEREFAKAILRLTEDDEKRKQFGKQARACAEQKYSWDIIARDLVRKYNALCRVHNDAPTRLGCETRIGK